MGEFRKMKVKNILLFFFVFVCLAGLTINSASAAYPKYSTHTATNYYYESNSQYEYDTGMYAWHPSKDHFNGFSTIREKYRGSSTQIQFYIYSNNNNPSHWVNTRSSTMTVKYKIKTSTKTYYKSKTVKYNKIGKTGSNKSITLKGPAGSQVLIYYMKWTQVSTVRIH